MKIIFFCCLPFYSCNSGIIGGLEGWRVASGSIEESKQRKMYIQSYCLLKNPFDSLKIKETFVERGWAYGKTPEETRPFHIDSLGGAFQFVVKIEEEIRNVYYNKYALRVSGTARYGHVLGAAVYCYIDSTLIRDTIIVDVINKENKNFDNWNAIGKLTFVKCKK